MNPLKCTFSVSAEKFLSFIIHENGIEIDPKRIEAIKKVEAPTCKKDLQEFLGKVNFLRRFISNLSVKIDAFTPILRLKNEAEFTWGRSNKRHLKRSRLTCLHHPCLRYIAKEFHSGFMWLLKIMSLGLF